jgi:hypothetical protein
LLENVVLERTFVLFANLEKTWLGNNIFITLFGLFGILLEYRVRTGQKESNSRTLQGLSRPCIRKFKD